MDNLTKSNKESGLTLIELLVAIGIFGLVVNMIFAIFMMAVNSQRRIIALKNVEDNLRFAIEFISREARMGSDFSLNGGALAFTNYKGEDIIYRLNNGAIEKSFNGGVDFSNLTGSELTINYLNFNLTGEASGDGLQPRITISIGATSVIGNQSGDLKVQTTISPRLLQI